MRDLASADCRARWVTVTVDPAGVAEARERDEIVVATDLGYVVAGDREELAREERRVLLDTLPLIIDGCERFIAAVDSGDLAAMARALYALARGRADHELITAVAFALTQPWARRAAADMAEATARVASERLAEIS